MLFKRFKAELGRVLAGSAPKVPLPDIDRKHGVWNHIDLDWMAAMVAMVPGDFAEIGVHYGLAFRRVAVLAHEQRKMAHAFDSFSGLAEPGPRDGQNYPKGKFDIGGPETFVIQMNKAGVPRHYYRLWPGYIPHCFEGVAADSGFSFVIVDVDHHQPTVDSLAWVAPRVSRRGILALDDYIPHAPALATMAIDEFLAREPGFDVIAQFNQHLILRKR